MTILVIANTITSHNISLMSSQGGYKISLIWFILAELLLIPVSEGLLYLKLSPAGKKRVFLVTYLANLTSCGAGLILSVIIHRWV